MSFQYPHGLRSGPAAADLRFSRYVSSKPARKPAKSNSPAAAAVLVMLAPLLPVASVPAPAPPPRLWWPLPSAAERVVGPFPPRRSALGVEGPTKAVAASGDAAAAARPTPAAASSAPAASSSAQASEGRPSRSRSRRWNLLAWWRLQPPATPAPAPTPAAGGGEGPSKLKPPLPSASSITAAVGRRGRILLPSRPPVGRGGRRCVASILLLVMVVVAGRADRLRAVCVSTLSDLRVGLVERVECVSDDDDLSIRQPTAPRSIDQRDEPAGATPGARPHFTRVSNAGVGG